MIPPLARTRTTHTANVAALRDHHGRIKQIEGERETRVLGEEERGRRRDADGERSRGLPSTTT